MNTLTFENSRDWFNFVLDSYRNEMFDEKYITIILQTNDTILFEIALPTWRELILNELEQFKRNSIYANQLRYSVDKRTKQITVYFYNNPKLKNSKSYNQNNS